MSDPTSPAGWGIQLSKLWTGAGQAYPVDARAIALEVTKQRFSDPIALVKPHGVAGIDGMLSKRQSKGDWCISYDEHVSVPGRINFTIAHELGHYLLHRGLQQEFRCGQFDVVELDGQLSRLIEGQANQFASYLLMPADDFRKQIDDDDPSMDALGACATRYGTSLTASALKFVELSAHADMVVVTRDGFVCWSYPSQLARRVRCYLAPGREVPASVDFGSRDRVAVGPGIWHPTLEAQQACIVSDQFDLQIFFLRFPGARVVLHDEEPEEDALDFILRRTRP
jgi:hypothetical protein